MTREMADVRRSLQNLTSLASVLSPEALIHSVQKTLQEMGVIRTTIYPAQVLVEEVVEVVAEAPLPPAPKPIAPPVKVREPRKSEMPTAPGPSRKVPTSTCYNPERYVPIRVLWAKVIIRAAYDYALWKESKDMRLRKFALDAERWLFESSDLELSFEKICEAFEFPVEKIRTRTRALTKNDVKKLEFRERHGRVDLTGGTFGGNDE